MNFDIAGINWIAVIVCSVAGFLLGGLWWMALFGKAWIDGYGFTEAEIEASHKQTGRNFAVFLVAGCVMAAAMAVLFKNLAVADAMSGAKAGAFVGSLFVGFVLLMQVMAGNYKLKALFIDVGYYGVWYTMMGAILGAWK